jgi:hypothetical protein
MPQNKELFVAAWAAISAYDKKLRENAWPIQMTIVAPDDWITNLLIPPLMFTTDSIENVEEMEFDLIVDFTDDRILALAPYGKKASSICGAFIGFEESVNELVTFKVPEKKYDVMIFPWSDESESLAYKVTQRFPDIISRNAYECDEGITEDNYEKSLTSSIVVGYRSAETYLAASANRIVIEGYDLETYDRNFLTKWTNPRYSMVCVEKKEDLDKNLSLIWRALERAINSIPRLVTT